MYGSGFGILWIIFYKLWTGWPYDTSVSTIGGEWYTIMTPQLLSYAMYYSGKRIVSSMLVERKTVDCYIDRVRYPCSWCSPPFVYTVRNSNRSVNQSIHPQITRIFQWINRNLPTNTQIVWSLQVKLLKRIKSITNSQPLNHVNQELLQQYRFEQRRLWISRMWRHGFC